MKLSSKAIEYCRDQSQYNVMKMWALKDDNLIQERVRAITVINPHLGFLCAQGSGQLASLLENDIVDYIDKKLEGNITSKRQFSCFLLVKLKKRLYDESWQLMLELGPRLIDELSVMEIIYGLMNCEEDKVALVVFYVGLQKCKRKLTQQFLSMIEDKDLFFVRTEENKKYFDTSIGYTIQNRDFRTLRLYLGNKNTLKKLFGYHSIYEGRAQLPYLCEEYFFEMALEERSNAVLFLMAEYITDILEIPNLLDSRMIPDNAKASAEDVNYVQELLNKYISEHGYTVPDEKVRNSWSYQSMHMIKTLNDSLSKVVR